MVTIDKYQKTYGSHLIDERKIKAEIIYNKYDFLGISKIIYFIAGGILMILSIYSCFNPDSCFWGKVKVFLILCMAIGVFIHSCALVLRTYISGYAPWSNSYETMVSLALIAVIGGLLFSRRDSMTCALASLFGGVALFVSELNWMDPQITPLVPVLKSPWLMFHVAALMASYGLLGISCLIGTVNLILSRFSIRYKIITIQIKRLTLINEMLLIIGLVLMATGIFLGAIWANESWGRYWGWDPKETWALISMIVYTFILHSHWFYPKDDSILFNLLSQWGFLSVLMTYFGVNHFLSGMHSYGNTSGLSNIDPAIFIPLVIFFTIPFICAYYPKHKRL
ncbi:MAG: cytochrome c biogenesis protein CcsA [Phocaeicola sp.]|nr:cytochrome c biogenesis protein CcsA [Phocaeicola sp.]